MCCMDILLKRLRLTFGAWSWRRSWRAARRSSLELLLSEAQTTELVEALLAGRLDAALLMLCSDAAEFITGADFVLDDGQTL